jgi:hypothetical protein
MTMGHWFTLAFVALFGLAWTASANAQEEHYGNRPYELNVNAGAHFIDEDAFGASDTDFGGGARIFLNMPSGWGFGGSFTWILSNADFDGSDFDVNTYLYSGEVSYTFASSNRIHPFVNAGVGAATVKVSDVPDEFDASETELLIPVGGGVKWFNASNSMGLRVDVRDNIIRATGDEDLGESDETLHNFEVSGGVSFFFGGGM